MPENRRDDRTQEKWAKVPELLATLYRAVERLEELFPGRKSTLDGHLIRSIGEVIAARMFDLELLPPSAEGHDAKTDDGRLVQVKLTQGNRSVALRGTDPPQHLLVFRLDKRDLGIETVYNGEGRQPWGGGGPAAKERSTFHRTFQT